ncbi:YigZ family protein [Shimazuella sp. AN120528]|uniref:YigZ family protein n=1 Tax=Shimazuella soli TaxID=1892854 RepID=UPI001F0FF2C6|nr:YigZ family protein [Shimazuella soli]MCH5585284.1 YigZ family protein [Shimazuella soli]
MGMTIGEFGKTEITIQKSRFICQAKRVETEEEANQFLTTIRKKYWDATHNCYAYIVTDQIQKSSDDGEPAGTAGRPILEVIHNKRLTYTAIVVTRYYGGIKLGTGGLVRAYSQGATAAIEAAGIALRSWYQQLILTFDYSFLGKMEHELHQAALILDTPVYSDKITWSVWAPVDKADYYKQAFIDWTAGQGTVMEGIQEEKIIAET